MKAKLALAVLFFSSSLFGQNNEERQCSFDLQKSNFALELIAKTYFSDKDSSLPLAVEGKVAGTSYNWSLSANLKAVVDSTRAKADILDQMSGELLIVKKKNQHYEQAEIEIDKIVEKFLNQNTALFSRDKSLLEISENLLNRILIDIQEITSIKEVYLPTAMCGEVRIHSFLSEVINALENYRDATQKIAIHVANFMYRQNLIFEITWKSTQRELRHKFIDQNTSTVDALRSQMNDGLELMGVLEHFVDWWYRTGEFHSSIEFKYCGYFEALRAYRIRIAELENYERLLTVKPGPLIAKERILEEILFRKQILENYVTDLERRGYISQLEKQQRKVSEYKSTASVTDTACQESLAKYPSPAPKNPTMDFFKEAASVFAVLVHNCEGE